MWQHSRSWAVAIIDRGVACVVVDHVPRAISSVCYLFLGKSSTISCQVTGTRYYSCDLPQGGLEIPCRLIFSGETRLIFKVQKFLQEALTSGFLTSCRTDSDPSCLAHSNLTVRSSSSLEMYWASAYTKPNLESWYTGFEQFFTCHSVLDEPDGAYFEISVTVDVKIGRERPIVLLVDVHTSHIDLKTSTKVEFCSIVNALLVEVFSCSILWDLNL